MKRTYSKTTATELAAWRRQHGLSVRGAAVKLGVSERTMERLLSGRQAIPLTLGKLADALSRIAALERKLYGPPDLTAAECERLAKAITGKSVTA